MRKSRFVCGVSSVVYVTSAASESAHAVGACCITDGTCLEASGVSNCIALGGEYSGDGTNCNLPGTCGGACCGPTGACLRITRFQCGQLAGSFDGLGTHCQLETACPGACCQYDGSCAVIGKIACEISAGVYQGSNTTCEGRVCTGACCILRGCLDGGAGACSDYLGEFQGFGTNCQTFDCDGACCAPGLGCIHLGSESNCLVSLAGVYQGHGTRCDTSPCYGACCFRDKSCQETTLPDCTAHGGSYAGHDTACATDCPSLLPTGFTYQGQLKRGGLPVNGPLDMRFTLWANEIDGAPLGPTIHADNVEVAGGLFTVNLDFEPAAYNGNARWLQIEVCDDCAPDGPYVVLTPRQLLTYTPFALQTRGIVVDAYGNVAIGEKTPNPYIKLDVAQPPEGVPIAVSGYSAVVSGTGVAGRADYGDEAFGVAGFSDEGYAGFFQGKVSVLAASPPQPSSSVSTTRSIRPIKNSSTPASRVRNNSISIPGTSRWTSAAKPGWNCPIGSTRSVRTYATS